MRKIFWIIIITGLFACGQRFHHDKESTAYNEIPSFNLLMLDSVSKFNTINIAEGKPTLLMYISPDCEHCQELTKNLLKNMPSLQETQIYMFTPMALSELKQFYDNFHLGDYKNITVGKDYEYAFYRFYHPQSFPCTAVYDKEKKLVKIYKGEITIDKIIEATRS